jgi:hypothetical protein
MLSHPGMFDSLRPMMRACVRASDLLMTRTAQCFHVVRIVVSTTTLERHDVVRLGCLHVPRWIAAQVFLAQVAIAAQDERAPLSVRGAVTARCGLARRASALLGFVLVAVPRVCEPWTAGHPAGRGQAVRHESIIADAPDSSRHPLPRVVRARHTWERRRCAARDSPDSVHASRSSPRRWRTVRLSSKRSRRVSCLRDRTNDTFALAVEVRR